MGANVARDFALDHAAMTRSLILVGAGAGAVNREQFLQAQAATAAGLEREGLAARVRAFDSVPTRASFKEKDPRGFAEFCARRGSMTPRRGPLRASERNDEFLWMPSRSSAVHRLSGTRFDVYPKGCVDGPHAENFAAAFQITRKLETITDRIDVPTMEQLLRERNSARTLPYLYSLL